MPMRTGSLRHAAADAAVRVTKMDQLGTAFSWDVFSVIAIAVAAAMIIYGNLRRSQKT
jgi:hypothetical protein